MNLKLAPVLNALVVWTCVPRLPPAASYLHRGARWLFFISLPFCISLCILFDFLLSLSFFVFFLCPFCTCHVKLLTVQQGKLTLPSAIFSSTFFLSVKILLPRGPLPPALFDYVAEMSRPSGEREALTPASGQNQGIFFKSLRIFFKDLGIFFKDLRIFFKYLRIYFKDLRIFFKDFRIFFKCWRIFFKDLRIFLKDLRIFFKVFRIFFQENIQEQDNNIL